MCARNNRTIDISEAVRISMRPLAKKMNPAILLIMRNWQMVMGNSYFKYCEPSKVSFRPESKSDGVLYINAFSSTVSFHVEHNRILVLEKVNALFGYSAISRIVIRQIPKIVEEYMPKKGRLVSNERLDVLFESIGDDLEDELSESLRRLGQAVLEFGNK